MEDTGLRRTFPKKQSWFGETSFKKPISKKVGLADDNGATMNDNVKQKDARKRKSTKKSKSGTKSMKEKRKLDGELTESGKDTLEEHRILGGLVDEMYGRDDDVVDMCEGTEQNSEEQSVAVPVVNAKKEVKQKLVKGNRKINSDGENGETDRNPKTPFDNEDISFDAVSMNAGNEDMNNELSSFRAEMAELPLGKVRELKEKLGLKLFNKAYFGSQGEGEQNTPRSEKASEEKKQRRGQHRPKEMSSKKPVSAFRPVYQSSIIKRKRRDPRFDKRAGEYKERCFEDNYQFLEELRKQEKEEFRVHAKQCEEQGDTDMAERLREVVRRMDNRERAKLEQKLKQETYKELRQENIERMLRGERPVFKTKAKVRMMQMEKKFQHLKKEHRLESYMKRKAKKVAIKESKKKHMINTDRKLADSR